MNTKKLINEIISLPIEERALVIDTILRSLNQPVSEIDKKWILEARKRLSEMRLSKVEPIPGNHVFEQIWQRFNK